jgi:hypothetical protein
MHEDAFGCFNESPFQIAGDVSTDLPRPGSPSPREPNPEIDSRRQSPGPWPCSEPAPRMALSSTSRLQRWLPLLRRVCLRPARSDKLGFDAVPGVVWKLPQSATNLPLCSLSDPEHPQPQRLALIPHSAGGIQTVGRVPFRNRTSASAMSVFSSTQPMCFLASSGFASLA